MPGSSDIIVSFSGGPVRFPLAHLPARRASPHPLTPMNPISALLICLGIFTVGYLYVFIAALRRDAREGQSLTPKPIMGVVSFIANFFDTLGVGSFATTTSMVRFFKLMP